eukprot:CAMPEP_0171681390 /NCGR_PEP_ID=MMETSP0990-20121206/57344_1 /TAXON_ID=483369 /ORGANISM="non described non described, Strain CCMP2098" /LENGTH=351 /DNA_ID=CAMNT_0012268437 /DNA_START=17 /DNA_END=1071 /DNA_ORIENTATION=+
MLGLQASNLEQQERLYKNQIRLGLREILQQELNFYNSALHNISSVSSIFAGVQLQWDAHGPVRLSKRVRPTLPHSPRVEAAGVLLQLRVRHHHLPVPAHLSLLQLRGPVQLPPGPEGRGHGGGALRHEGARSGEYKIVLYSLTLSAISWLMTLSLLAALKLERRDRGIVIGVAMPTACMVIYLYRRARDMFYLNKKDRFAGSTAPDRGFLAKTADVLTGGYRKGDFGGDGPDGGGKGGRLADLVRDVDVRNNSLGETKSPSRPGQPILDGGVGNEGATPYYLDNSRGGDNGGVGGGDSMGSAASSAASSSQREGSESNQEKGRAVAFGPKGPPLAGMKAKKKSMFSVNFFK